MDLQLLTGTHILGSGASSVGRTVKATPLHGQFIDASTVDTTAIVMTATTGSDGTWSLNLIQGVIYDIKIDKWGMRTIRISADAEKAFTTYLGETPAINGSVPGSIKFETGESVVFFTYLNGELDADGNPIYALGFRVVA